MRYEEIKIAGSSNARLALYIQESYPEMYGDRKRPMILICPGGGYEHVSPREAEPIALQFLSFGCNAAVLWYDVSSQGAKFPDQLVQLCRSMAHIRENASEYSVDADKIIVAGFSAGGHLAASLGCFWNKEWLEAESGLSSRIVKPNGLILAYPVITSGEYAHNGSFVKLLGSGDSEEARKNVSLEYFVTKDVPPVFMWHTCEDRSVPLENSLLFANALRKAGVGFEYHVFPHGGHGYALATKETAIVPEMKEIEPQCAQWIQLCKSWLEYVI